MTPSTTGLTTACSNAPNLNQSLVSGASIAGAIIATAAKPKPIAVAHSCNPPLPSTQGYAATRKNTTAKTIPNDRSDERGSSCKACIDSCVTTVPPIPGQAQKASPAPQGGRGVGSAGAATNLTSITPTKPYSCEMNAV